MKRLILLLTFGVCTLNSCEEDNLIETNKGVQFTLAISSDGVNSAVDLDEYPEQIRAEISVSYINGVTILNKEIIKFTKTRSSYLSDPITLENGSYIINEFNVLNDEIETFSTTELNFSVSANDVKVIVIPSKARCAKGAHPMHLAAYVEQGGILKLTEATAYISNGQGESYEYSLSPKKNHIFFKGNPNASYTIEIRKEGYEPYINTFIYSQLEKNALK